MLGISPNFASGKFENQICSLAAEMPFENVQKYLENEENIVISETRDVSISQCLILKFLSMIIPPFLFNSPDSSPCLTQDGSWKGTLIIWFILFSFRSR